MGHLWLTDNMTPENSFFHLCPFSYNAFDGFRWNIYHPVCFNVSCVHRNTHHNGMSWRMVVGSITMIADCCLCDNALRCDHLNTHAETKPLKMARVNCVVNVLNVTRGLF